MAHIHTAARPAARLAAWRPQRAPLALALALAAPATSLHPALTTGLRGTGTAISFPHGFVTALVVTAVVTAAASGAAARLAGRAALAAITPAMALWFLIGAGVAAAGLSTGTGRLTDWGIILLTAAAAGMAGWLLARRRSRR